MGKYFYYKTMIFCMFLQNLLASPTFIDYGDRGLSEKAKGTLAFYQTLPEGVVLFSGFPDRLDDLVAWKAKDTAVQQFSSGDMLTDVLKRYAPTLSNKNVGGVGVIEVEPQSIKDKSNVLVYVHGGGFVSQNATSSLVGAVPLAHEMETKVVVIDYTPAPFAKHTDIVDEVSRVISTLRQQDLKLGAYGDSAGANILLSTLLQLKEPIPAVLISPWLNIACDGPTYKGVDERDYILGRDDLLKVAKAYAGETSLSDARVSPLNHDFNQTPFPIQIIGGSAEILRSDWDTLSQTLKDKSWDHEYYIYPKLWHVFPIFGWDLPESIDARSKMARFFNQNM